MPAPGEIAVVVVIGLAVLLSIRILIAVPAWVRQARRPETRAIRVVGVGGGGSNAVDRMVKARIPGVSFIACNTDAQALRRSMAPTKLRIGAAITGGLGSGGDPDVGRRAAEEDEERIVRSVAGADLVFITAGLGGGTGSGAAPIVAASARNHGALTIAVVTKPFGFEGSHRMRIAEAAAAELAAQVDALIVVPNDRVNDVIAEDASMIAAFRVVDDVLLQAVQGIIDLINAPGLINLDFADVRSVMKDAGPALIGLGRGTGEHRAIDAARQAVDSPLLEADIEGARGILFSVSGPQDLGLREVRQAADVIRERADDSANVIFGASFNEALGEDVLITLIATGLSREQRTAAPPTARSSFDRPAPKGVEPRPDESRPDEPRAEEPRLPEPALKAAEPRPDEPRPDDQRPDEPAPKAEEPRPLEPAPKAEEPRLPKIPARSVRVREVPEEDTTIDPTPRVRPRSAGGPELSDHEAQSASTTDDDDLDVPSFLRRRGQPTSRR